MTTATTAINGLETEILQSTAWKLRYCNQRPGNWDGLFLFQHFINMSLTYSLMTLTHLLTDPGPTWKHSYYVHS